MSCTRCLHVPILKDFLSIVADCGALFSPKQSLSPAQAYLSGPTTQMLSFLPIADASPLLDADVALLLEVDAFSGVVRILSTDHEVKKLAIDERTSQVPR